ncbi:MBL fold metallo-hydrolase [Paenibacillaceae bacterium WGS1546]|uniref:MBL fold metallo-hydrolase n=1 Tax=Cohnella sp. WGS1546 TaxID=3366810 RepID=UPI00372D168A
MKATATVELADGWLQARVPLPFSLKWVNAYLLPERSGWTMIDPGLRTEEAEAFWTAALAERGIRWQDIGRIVLTHHHPDHYGMAGWMQERTGGQVWMSEVALDNAIRLWGEGETFTEEMTEAFLTHGLASELEDRIREHLSGFRSKVSPSPAEAKKLSPGGKFAMGGVEWDIHGGEGHAPGHLLFHDPGSGKLICGDQALPDITPNIGWMPGGDPDPLLSYLDSLRRLSLLEVRMAYPGHRDPYPGFRARVAELLDHHERRLRKMAESIGEPASTAFEICEALFGVRLRENPHNLRFALAETIAHLVRLENTGDVVRTEAATPGGMRPVIRYRKA